VNSSEPVKGMVTDTVTLQLLEEHQVVAPLFLAELDHREQLGLDNGAKPFGTGARSQQRPAPAQVVEPVDENGVDQSILRPEVVLHDGAICHAGFRSDLAERHAIDTVHREETFGRQNQLLLGGPFGRVCGQGAPCHAVNANTVGQCESTAVNSFRLDTLGGTMALRGAQSYSDVMMTEPPSSSSPFESATLEFLFEQVWARPGLSRRQRRLVTLSCVCAADTTGPMDAHMYAALASGDLDPEELQEFILHFAVYCGWPKASVAQTSLLTQLHRLSEERGEEMAPWPDLPLASLGPADHEERLRKGEECFVEVNLTPAPPLTTPYFQAGILNFVFGHVWQRPNLSRIDRRYVTIPCVGLSDAAMPIQSHVVSALRSGDISISEMNEIVLQFSAYYGFAKGEVLNRVATDAWAEITAERTPGTA